MSTATPPAAPSPDVAYQQIMSEVYEPVFFAKAGEFGLQPTSEHEARQMLRMGAQLYVQYQQGLAKHAADRGSFLDYAAENLDQVSGVAAGDTASAYKAAAAGFLAAPGILDAADALNAAMAAARA